MATVGVYVYDHFKIGPLLVEAYQRAVNPSPCLFFNTPEAALGLMRQGEWEEARQICASKRQGLANLNHVGLDHIFFEHELPPKQKALERLILYHWRLTRAHEMTEHLWNYIRPNIGYIDTIQEDQWVILQDPPITNYKTLKAFSEARIQEIIDRCSKDIHRVTCLQKSLSIEALTGALAIIDSTLIKADVHRVTASVHQWIKTPLEYGIARSWNPNEEDIQVVWKSLQFYIERHSRNHDQGSVSSIDTEGLHALCLIYHMLCDFCSSVKWPIGLIFRRSPSEHEHFYMLNELSIQLKK